MSTSQRVITSPSVALTSVGLHVFLVVKVVDAEFRFSTTRVATGSDIEIGSSAGAQGPSAMLSKSPQKGP